MRIGNVEGDELLMQIAMSVGKRKYYLEMPSGYRKLLSGSQYRAGGRFDRRKALAYLGRAISKETLEQSEIVLDIEAEGKEDLAIMLLNREIRKLYYLTKCDRLDFYIGDPGTNFRFKSAITQPYKAGREDKPPIIDLLREYLIGVHGATLATGYEADDMLGIYQTEDTIAIHCDKDINMIPGQHWNTKTDTLWEVPWFVGFALPPDSGELYLSGKEVKGHGLAWFYAQMLLGDKTDNIPNLRRGMGDKTVYDILTHCATEKDYLSAVVEQFKKEPCYISGCTDLSHTGKWGVEFTGASRLTWQERLCEQADLVWICRNREEKGSDYIKRKMKEYSIDEI